MKQVTIVIDHDELEELLREHIGSLFPGMEIAGITGLGYGDTTVRLRKPFVMPPIIDPLPSPPTPHSEPEEMPF
jgi:hypothetical protein